MKKYVKVCSPHECRNFARLGALYWRFASRGASPYTEWRLGLAVLEEEDD